MNGFLSFTGRPIRIVMNNDWAFRYRPLSFEIPADAALYGTVDWIKQGRTGEGYFLASDVEFSPEGIAFSLSGAELFFVPEDWEHAWQASFTPRKTLNLADVTDDWLTLMIRHRVFDGKRGKEKKREKKDYLVNTVHGLRFLHEQEEGEELTMLAAVEQVVEALEDGKEGSHFPDNNPLPWPEKWTTPGALLRAVNRDRKEAAEIRGWTIKRGRPKGKKPTSEPQILFVLFSVIPIGTLCNRNLNKHISGGYNHAYH